jgi:hypothetical protein
VLSYVNEDLRIKFKGVFYWESMTVY